MRYDWAKSISQLNNVKEVKLLKLDRLGCTRFMSPSTVIGLQDRSKVRSVASFELAERTRHSDAVKKVEFNRSSAMLKGQLVKTWYKNAIRIGNSFKLSEKFSPPILLRVIASLN